MSKSDESYDEAFQAGRTATNAGYLQEAVVHFYGAYLMARKSECMNDAFVAGLHVGIIRQLQGEPLEALSILTEILREIPESEVDQDTYAAAGFQSVQISLLYSPNRSRLDAGINRLRCDDVDFRVIKGRVLYAFGEFSEAVRQYEIAMASWKQNNSPRQMIAYHCVRACLDGQLLDYAQTWLGLLRGMERDENRYETLLLACEAILGLGLQSPVSLVAIHRLAARIIESEEIGVVVLVCEAVARHHMLHQDTDPAGADSPARSIIKQARRSGSLHVHARFDRLLLLLDFRLSAVRYAIGVRAVDDRFYRVEQDLVSAVVPPDIEEFSNRVLRCRRAYARAIRIARNLDQALECQWRQQRVNARLPRLDALCAAVKRIK